MTPGALLKALKHDEAFSPELADVPLGRCAVWVCASASNEEPTAAEAAAARELRGAKTLGELTVDLAGAASGACTNLFVRVALPHAAPGPYDASPQASALLKALRAAQPEPMAGSKSGASLLRLPPGVRWPQLGDAPLFVRHFYRDCFEGPMGSLKPGGRFTIIGNPGIGKSAFGEYLMWQAVRARRTVVHISDKAVGCTIFRADGRASVLPHSAFTALLPELCDPLTVLVYDGNGEGKGCPPIVPATTVLVTSPKRSRFKEFEREGGDLLFFPVFSRNEIDDLLEAAFPALHTPAGRQGVWERYDKWGGIPRAVLNRIGTAAQAQLAGAVTAIDLDKLAHVLSHPEGIFFEDDGAISHRLFHLKPQGETDNGFVGGATTDAYILHRTETASPAVEDMVDAAMQAGRSEALNSLLALPTANPSVAKFISDAFERHALRTLSCGGTFDAYDLTAKRHETLQFPPSERRFFSGFDGLRPAAAAAADSGMPVTLVPRATNFPAIDAVLPGNVFVNAALDKSHDLLLQGKRATAGLAPLCEALGACSPVKFVWAVPHDRFADFCRRGKPAAFTGATLSGLLVDQFVLRVPPPPWRAGGKVSRAVPEEVTVQAV